MQTLKIVKMILSSAFIIVLEKNEDVTKIKGSFRFILYIGFNSKTDTCGLCNLKMSVIKLVKIFEFEIPLKND